ncbi:hypothetical protein LTR49_025121 [Elasticomyces elasticus]|nr:hypothetical protein LTR49_025121 [Elasticomyces elasticus]
MFWGTVIVIPGVLCQAASFAELSSMLPIAGAQYHWTWVLAPRKYRKLITWMQGWVTWFSWIAILAGAINLTANITTTLVAASHPDYTVRGWHTVLLMYAFLVVLGLLNTYGFWLVPYLESVAAVIHVLLWVAIIPVLACFAPRHSPEFVFFADTTSSGWSAGPVSFLIGASFVTWGFVAFDSTVHISEDTKKPSHAVPHSLFWSLSINALLALAMTIVISFHLGDVEDVMMAIYPLMLIFQTATGSVWAASAIIGCFLWINISSCIGSIASTSRLTWAWARDGALPSYFAMVDPKLQIPVHSIWLPIVIVMMISLLNLANSLAFAVIISLSLFGLYLSYLTAIACMLYARLTGTVPVRPWSLGRAGPWINLYAILHSAFFGVFVAFPVSLPITAANMNYALPITALVCVLALIAWITWAQKHWQGLNDKIIEKNMRSTSLYEGQA